jgi:enoyl-[acyl-carrier protein] reductase III
MKRRRWALILGASSGFGAATALELAKAHFNIIGVHLDRRSTMQHVDSLIEQIESHGAETHFFNLNAASQEKRKFVIAFLGEALGTSLPAPPVNLVMHSLAFGVLRRFVAPAADEAINSTQMDLTLDVMAHSLVYWSQDLLAAGLIGTGTKIFAMTSSGGERVLPFYGAVSAAKAALEAHVRQLAVELLPRGISVNAIRAGVTDTPALRKIPGAETLIEKVQGKNPGGRMTTPEDVAQVIAAFARVKTDWMTGNVIGVDGGEHLID